MTLLKPCPLCGQEVKSVKVPSPDGTVTWVLISHGPTVPCGVSFIGDESTGIEGWNKRTPELTESEHYTGITHPNG